MSVETLKLKDQYDTFSLSFFMREDKLIFKDENYGEYEFDHHEMHLLKLWLEEHLK